MGDAGRFWESLPTGRQPVSLPQKGELEKKQWVSRGRVADVGIVKVCECMKQPDDKLVRSLPSTEFLYPALPCK